MKSVTAFAPATVANVAVGFDLLGFPFDPVGDEVTLMRAKKPDVVIDQIVPLESANLPEGCLETLRKDCAGLPREAAKNTATVGLLRLIKDLRLDFGFKLVIRKGIPLGSGMGGSAASAVAALVAANSFLEAPLEKERLLSYALLGEEAASGAAHPDNVAACLYGGLTLARVRASERGQKAGGNVVDQARREPRRETIDVVQIPMPENIYCVLVHPHARLDTKDARKALKKTVDLADHVRQSANLGGFIAGCYRNDLDLIRRSMNDELIEPQRAPLIKGFDAVKGAAIGQGALGCSISGSGPSVFAWTDSEALATKIRKAMVKAFEKSGVASDWWVAPVNGEGAKVVSLEPLWERL